jgi:VanZ family protein
VKLLADRSLRFRLAASAFALYLIALFLFTFFPRPILETGDPAQIQEFLRAHANFFYKILYADANSVATGNYFMLTPFIVMAHLVFPHTHLFKLFISGVLLSGLIEIAQIYIPGRVSDPVDFASNSASLLIGIAVIAVGRFFAK